MESLLNQIGNDRYKHMYNDMIEFKALGETEVHDRVALKIVALVDKDIQETKKRVETLIEGSKAMEINKIKLENLKQFLGGLNNGIL